MFIQPLANSVNIMNVIKLQTGLLNRLRVVCGKPDKETKDLINNVSLESHVFSTTAKVLVAEMITQRFKGDFCPGCSIHRPEPFVKLYNQP